MQGEKHGVRERETFIKVLLYTDTPKSFWFGLCYEPSSQISSCKCCLVFLSWYEFWGANLQCAVAVVFVDTAVVVGAVLLVASVPP